jgi:hypothetical protein
VAETFPFHGHRMQHSDAPTWCVDCGNFDCHCWIGPCPDPGAGRFDTRKPDVFVRIVADFFPSLSKAATRG